MKPEVKLAQLETNQSNLMKQLEAMNAENKEDHRSITDSLVRLELKLDLALEKKANKWVEKALVGFIVLILTGVASYVGTLILRTVIHLN